MSHSQIHEPTTAPALSTLRRVQSANFEFDT